MHNNNTNAAPMPGYHGGCGEIEARQRASLDVANLPGIKCQPGKDGELQSLAAELRDSALRLDREFGELASKLSPVLCDVNHARPEEVATGGHCQLSNDIAAVINHLNSLSNAVVELRSRVQL